MQKQLDRVTAENRELRTVVNSVIETTGITQRAVAEVSERVNRFGRNADVALANATWGSAHLRKDQNRQAAKEAV
eukprot:15447722-Alexandrium_andersonii.AAC.1